MPGTSSGTVNELIVNARRPVASTVARSTWASRVGSNHRRSRENGVGVAGRLANVAAKAPAAAVTSMFMVPPKGASELRTTGELLG